MSVSSSAPKYSKDAPFEDPVVRCDGCHRIVLREKFIKAGMCPLCGNRRLSNFQAGTLEEWRQIKSWEVDPEWLALFEEVND